MKNQTFPGTKNEGVSVMIQMRTRNVITERDATILPTKTESRTNTKSDGMIQRKKKIVSTDVKKRNDRADTIVTRVMIREERRKSIKNDTDQIRTMNDAIGRGIDDLVTEIERRIILGKGSITVPEMKKIVGRKDEQTGIVRNETE